MLHVGAVGNPVRIGIEPRARLAQGLGGGHDQVGAAAQVGLHGGQRVGETAHVGVVVGTVVDNQARRHARQDIDRVRQAGDQHRPSQPEPSDIAAQHRRQQGLTDPVGGAPAGQARGRVVWHGHEVATHPHTLLGLLGRAQRLAQLRGERTTASQTKWRQGRLNVQNATTTPREVAREVVFAEAGRA